MDAIVERAAGVDVGQAFVVVTVILGAAHERPRKQTRTFPTMTRDLLALREWLGSVGVTQVGMEGTGVYWKSVHAILEDAFDVIVGNAYHIKNVPGRKTDVKDSEWLANLVRHGLIARSFIPPPSIRTLRDLMRFRRKLVESRTTERNRVLKVLEVGNVKLSAVATDVFGVSGMLMLRALAEGQGTPEEIANLAKGKLRLKLSDLANALQGALGDHHRFQLKMQLRRLDFLAEDLDTLEVRIDEEMRPFLAQHTALQEIPGVSGIVASTLIAELGIDMSVFGDAHRASAWAGLCPGNNESGGPDAARARGAPTSTCAPSSWRRPRRHLVPGTPTSATSSTGCGAEAARAERPWPSRAKSSLPRTPSFPARPTGSSERPTSTRSHAAVRSAPSPAGSSGSAST
jgi:transposase